MTLSETQHGTELPLEPRTQRRPPRRRALAAGAVGVAAVVAASAGVAIVRDGGSSQGAASVVAPTTPEAKIASAMLAAPAAVSKDAKVLDWPGEDLAYPELRAGTNGWTCLPDYAVTPAEDPMCVDRNAKAWLDAYYAGKEPKIKAPGVIYMLRGSGDFSRTDAMATKLEPGHDWVNDGPHISLVSPGRFDPDDYASLGMAAPWVMWAGGPYEHLHVPIG